jgi:hypothetical protein
MEAAGAFESLVTVYQTTWRYFPKDNILHLPALTFPKGQVILTYIRISIIWEMFSSRIPCGKLKWEQ